MESKIVKTQEASDRIYTWIIIDNQPRNDLEDIRIDVNCVSCNQEGQFYWQEKETLTLIFYCPNSHTTWRIICKYKE